MRYWQHRLKQKKRRKYTISSPQTWDPQITSISGLKSRRDLLVGEGDYDQGQKSWNSVADVAPVDLRNIPNHQASAYYQRPSCCI